MLPVKSIALGAVGLVVVNAAWLRYLALIPRERVPRRPRGALSAMGVGSFLAIIGVALGPGIATATLAALTLGLAGFFVYLLSLAPQPAGLRLEVGDRLLPFTATTSEGEPFSSESLHGRRVLLKFFRGHW